MSVTETKKIKKKRKRDATEAEPESIADEVPSCSEDGTESVMDPTETETTTVQEENYQKEFLVLGQKEYQEVSKIKVVSSWIEKASTFSADLRKDNLSSLESISGLPKELAERVATQLPSWFPVQKSVLPLLLSEVSRPPALRSRDIAISAPTGCGKTLTYVLPVLAAVSNRKHHQLTALIVVPVQTLVDQIEKEFARFNVCGARVVAISGTHDFEKERRFLMKNAGLKSPPFDGGCPVDVLIATPSRLVDHLVHPQCNIHLDRLRYLIVDEADRMGPQVRIEWLDLVERRSGGSLRATNLDEILGTLSAPQKILLSATLSKDVEELHLWNLHRPCLFRASVDSANIVSLDKTEDHVTGNLALPASIRHRVLESEQKWHPLVLYREIIDSTWKRVLVFTNDKTAAFRLSTLLIRLAYGQFTVGHLSADIPDGQRRRMLKKFSEGQIRVLICSDVLSRGVDILDVDCVVNYQTPGDDRLFVHRAGRTGRAGKNGVVLSLVDKEKHRAYVKMLTKRGLWTNSEEIEVSMEALNSHTDAYKEALDALKEKVAGKDQKTNNKKSVSGRAFAKQRKWMKPEVYNAKREAKLPFWKKEKESKRKALLHDAQHWVDNKQVETNKTVV